MASLLVRARSFGTRKGAKLLHPGPDRPGPPERYYLPRGIMGGLCMHKKWPEPQQKPWPGSGDAWSIGPGLKAELAAEAEGALPKLEALLVVHELVAVALLEFRQSLLFGR